MSRAPSHLSVFNALASETRRALLDVLRDGEATVSTLVDGLNISQPAVSQQLNVLRAAGLVEERADGRFRYYRLCPAPLAEVDAWIERYRVFWTSRLDALGAVLDEMPDEPATPPPPQGKQPKHRRRSS
ncbi:MAG: metalloregulator ArsR/SmtB family transcription factor [Polyangiaceae bacterium]